MTKTVPLETPRKRLAALTLFCGSLVLASSAQAVTQPSGTTVPVLDTGVTTCADRNVQMCLNDSEGGPAVIDAQADALTAPETFEPTCQLTFTPIVKGGYNNAGFGWYNVKPDPANAGKFLKPLQTELYGMLFLNTHQQTGAQVAGQSATLDLAIERAAGRYTGGKIGFFLASGPYTFNAATHAFVGTINELFFTQHELNPGSAAAKPYIQVLTWQSVKQPQSFYFGWEDQTASLSSDNDFDDLVFLVGGIQCSGSGDACDTGKAGVCALVVQTGIIPPTINQFTTDPACDLDSAPNKAVKRHVDVALSNSFGFGGHNVTLAIRRAA